VEVSIDTRTCSFDDDNFISKPIHDCFGEERAHRDLISSAPSWRGGRLFSWNVKESGRSGHIKDQ
jgi:hypothetical protein